MLNLKKNASAQMVRSQLRILSKRLKSRPDTAPLAAEVDAARAEIDRRLPVWEEASDDAVVATGALNYADGVEDAAVAKIARRAKVLVEGKLTAPLYVRLFPSAASELTSGLADDAQATLVGNLIGTIAEDEVYARLRKVARELAAAHTEVVAAQAERVLRDQESTQAWTELQIAVDAGRAVHYDTRPKLEVLLPRQKRLVDSFFGGRKEKRKATSSAPSSLPG